VSKMVSKKTLLNILFGLIGIGVLYWTVSIYGMDNYINVFLKASPIFILLAILAPLAEEISASYQLKTVFKSTNMPLSFKDMFWIELWGSFLGDLQKGIGIFVIIDSIAVKAKISHIDSTSRFSLYYAVAMIIRAVATGVGIFYFMRVVPVQYQSIVMFFIILVFLGAIGLLLTVFGNKTIKSLIIKVFGKVPIMGKIVNNMVQIDVKEPKTTILTLFALGTFNWIMSASHWLFISYAIGYPIDFWFCLATVSLISLVKLIPLFPSSIGVYDLALAAGLGVVNIPVYVGLSFAMIERFTDIASNTIAVLKPEYLRFFKDVGKNG